MKIAQQDSVTRLLAAAFGAAVFVAIATPVAQHLNYQLTPAVQLLVAAVGAGVAFFGLRGLADFTSDCMSVPTAGARMAGPVTPRPTGAPTLAEETGNTTVVLEKTRQPDGTVRVKVTSNGLTKREFNILRARLANTKVLPTIKWEHPVNLKEGKRTIEGTIAASPAQAGIVERLEETVGRKV